MNVDTLTGGKLLPEFEDVCPLVVFGFNDGMNMDVPVVRTTSNFKNEGAALDVKLPAFRLSEFAEAFNDFRNHEREVGLVFDGECEVFESVSGSGFDITDKEFKT